MLDFDFKNINKIFDDELNKESIKNVIAISKRLLPLCDNILNNCSLLSSCTCNIEINDSFSLAYSYLKDKHPIYYDEIMRMKNGNEIHIADYSLDNASCDSYTGEIWLGKNKNILDDLNLIHEFFHHLNLKPLNNGGEENTIARELFGESISISSEIDFERSLDISLREDAKKFEVDYINDAIDCAKKIKIEILLVDLYLIYGKIDKDIISDFLENNKDNLVSSTMIDEVDNVIGNISGWGSSLKISFNLKYVIGIVFGYYLADKISNNYENWNIIYDLNKNLYNLSFDDVFKKICPSEDLTELFDCFFSHYKELCMNNEKTTTI